MRLVLDTSVLLAAYLTRGVCHELVEHARRTHRLVSSDHLLQELEAKLVTKLKVPAEKAAAAVALVRAETELVRPSPLVPQVCRDQDDDWVLATAVTGTCDCIVTGDKDLLVLKAFAGIPIVSPGDFWRHESQQR